MQIAAIRFVYNATDFLFGYLQGEIWRRNGTVPGRRKKMFKKDDYIVYGNAGVCRVEAVGPMGFGDGSRIYYTLEPVYEKGSRFFTPVDNDKVVMRPVLTMEECSRLIGEFAVIEEADIPDNKYREDVFRDTLKNCDCKECIRIIKALHHRISSRAELGKKATSSDEKYFHLAKESLYGELAFSMKTSKSQIEKCIMDEMELSGEV